MAIFLKNATFLHIPKTGGTWVRKQLQNMGLVEEIVYGQDCEPQFGTGRTNIHNIPIYDERFDVDRLVFCFVRNPLDWYKSYFGYRQITPWVHDSLRLDMFCESKDFNEFIDKVIQNFPFGYCTRLYSFFKECHHVSPYVWVGRQENLKSDLIKILNTFQIEFDESKITDDKINDSETSQYIYTPEQERKIRAIEKEVFTIYYKGE